MSRVSEGQCQECFADAVLDCVCGRCGAVQGGARRDRRALPLWTVVAGRYLIGKVLGAGGFGITYLAQDTQLNRRVAIKEYFPSGLVTRADDGVEVVFNASEDEAPFMRGLKRFFDEGKHLARFNHPNIVLVHDALEANGTAYLVMEYLAGMTLKKWLGDVKRFDTQKALQLMHFILDALKAVHRENLVHRDIKPDNVYVTESGRVLLLDFGGAKQLTSDGDRSMDAMFAHGYAAPEQYFADSGKVGAWTDVYGAAATLYHLLNGVKLPSALERNPDSPRLDWPASDVPTAVQRVVEKAVSLKQTQRFQTVSALAEALPNLSVAPLPPRPSPPPPPAPRSPPPSPPPQRSPSTSGASNTPRVGIAGAIVAAAAAGLIGWHLYTRPANDVVPTRTATTTPAPAPSPSPSPPAPTPTPTPLNPGDVLNDMLDHVAAGNWARVDQAVLAIRSVHPGGESAPASGAGLVTQADAAIERGEYREAVKLLQQAVKDAPRAAEAWAALGFAQMRCGQPADAKVAAKQSLSIEADNASAWVTMAEALGIEPSGSGSAEAIQLAVYFSKDRPAMIKYLKQTSYLAPSFRSIVAQQGRAMDRVPARRT